MQIINMHVHMIQLEKALEKPLPSGPTIFKNVEETMKLTAPEKLIGQMDEAGIEQSVLYACEAPIIYSSNEYVAGLCARYPDRLIGFASAHPLKANAASLIEEAIIKLGMKGVKFHPPLQNFYPNDPAVFAVYQRITELNVPVVFHIGTTPFAGLVRLDQANPILLDEVACAFPKMKIILTHLGTLWSDEAFMVVEKNPNVFIDTAAYIYEISQLLTSDLIARLGENKFLFGTDYPTPFGGGVHRMKDFVEAIRALKLSDEIKEKIFYQNFTQLLNS